MSRESKPRDRWSQVFTASHSRPEMWCKGCGYYRVMHGEHRADCMAPRCADCGAQLSRPKSVETGRCLECRLWPTSQISAGWSGREGEGINE